MIGAESWIFCLKGFDFSYRPPIGLAAARIDVRAFNVAWGKDNIRDKHVKDSDKLLFFWRLSRT